MTRSMLISNMNENIEIASKYEQFIQFYKYIFKES